MKRSHFNFYFTKWHFLIWFLFFAFFPGLLTWTYGRFNEPFEPPEDNVRTPGIDGGDEEMFNFTIKTDKKIYIGGESEPINGTLFLRRANE